MKKSFILYHDQKDTFEALSPKRCKELLLAIFDYSSMEKSKVSNYLKIIFIPFKKQLDRDRRNWKKTREARRISGQKGGKTRVANQAIASFAKQSKQSQANQAVNVNVNGNGIYKKGKKTPKVGRAKTPPGIAKVFSSYKEKINPKARLLTKARAKIMTRLLVWTTADLLKAIDHFSKDTWWMENNAHRGIAWFFHTDERVEQLINLKPRDSKPDPLKGYVPYDPKIHK